MPTRYSVLKCEVCGRRYQLSKGSSKHWCAVCTPKIEKAASMVLDDDERALYRKYKQSVKAQEKKR